MRRFSGLWVALGLLFTSPLFAQEHFVVLQSSTPRDALDRYWEPVITKSIAQFLKKTEPNLEIHRIRIDDLNALGARLQSLMSKSGKLKGIALTGHGSDHSFYMSGQEHFTGGEFGRLLISQLREIPLSEHFMIYLNSCLNFERHAKLPRDIGFEIALSESLQNWISPEEGEISIPGLPEEARVRSVSLAGHRGVAGWLGLLPLLPYDHLFKAFRLKPKVETQAQIKLWFAKLFVISSLATWGVLAGGNQLFAESFSPSLKVLTGLGLMTSAGLSGLSFWNYVSKLGRLIHIHRGYAVVDENLWIHRAIHEGIEHKSCRQTYELAAVSPKSKMRIYGRP